MKIFRSCQSNTQVVGYTYIIYIYILLSTSKILFGDEKVETLIIKFTSFRGYETSSTCNCGRFSWENRVQSCKSQTKHQTIRMSYKMSPLRSLSSCPNTTLKNHVVGKSPTTGFPAFFPSVAFLRGWKRHSLLFKLRKRMQPPCVLYWFVWPLGGVWNFEKTPVLGNRVKCHATSLQRRPLTLYS